MKIKNKLKKLYLNLPSNVKNNFYKVYDFFVYPANRKRKIIRNKLDDEFFYIIRPRDNTVEGLMSLLLNAVRQAKYADENKYIPLFDFSNLKTQYSLNDENHNVWDDFFVQKYKLEDIYKYNVIYGNLSPTRTDFLDFSKWTQVEQINESRRLINKYVFPNKTVLDIVDKEITQFDVADTLGLYCRGTDYTALKPAGHPIQPSIDEITIKVDEYLKTYNLKHIFLVTEDNSIYSALKEKYKDKLIIASYDTFISNYDGKEFLSNSNSVNDISYNPYIRGLNYFAKILILSKLNYLIAGNTAGSWATVSFSKGFKDYFIFNLGLY